MAIASLAIKSFRNRKFSAGLAIASITLSVALLLGVEILRNEAKTSFTSTISGTDLIVGARTSSTHLLLYSVFGIGSPNNNLSWSSYRELSRHPQVRWSIPISMGDSHRGFRVLGTDRNFFEHYRFARERHLKMRAGDWFAHADEAVLGAEAARSLGYRIGDEIIVAHGAGDESFIRHDDDPFRVSGILERTGTPVDRAVFVSLEGFDGMHDDWRYGGQQQAPRGGAHAHDVLAGIPARKHGDRAAETEHAHDEHAKEQAHDHDDHTEGSEHAPGDHAAETEHEHDEHAAEPGHAHDDHAAEPEHGHGHDAGGQRSISAFMLGLNSRPAALPMQRVINEFEHEPLLAILPGYTLLELWEIVGLVENTLLAVSAFVVVVGLSSMLIILMTSINERRREMAILRAAGARPAHIFLLILGEAVFITLSGIVLGSALVSVAILFAQDWVAREFGLFIGLNWLAANQLIMLAVVAAAGCVAGIIPGLRIYRYSLSDGMSVRS